MTYLEEFSRTAAKRYLQNIVFVDDEIYVKASGQPTITTADIPPFPTPFISGQTQLIKAVVEQQIDQKKIPYHPQHLVQSFAREGMVCALYQPTENFDTGKGSELFKLCERTDVVILDWDLFGYDGKNLVPLIGNLVDESQNSVPHHSRLCVIYTTKPALDRVASAIYDYLSNASLAVEAVTKPATLIAGATRIIVLGKPDVPGRTEEIKALEVLEEKLAERVIEEFAKMHSGILPSYALRGMAAIRRNSKKILDKFQNDMDAAFLLHRALLIADEDAFEQLPELLSEEVLAVMLDDQIQQENAMQLVRDVASTMSLQALDWQSIQGRSVRPGELAQLYLVGGKAAIAKDYKFKKDKVPIADIHAALGCKESQGDKKLAALFNVRTRYFSTKSPSLGFGTIVRWREENKPANPLQYGFCLMPICDGMRLDQGGTKTSFPFWTLKFGGNGAKGRGIVILTKEKSYLNLLAVVGRPRDLLWIDQFAPSASGTVTAIEENTSFWFKGNQKNLEWVAQLKPGHAQRVAHDIGQSFSRVGVVEAEWLRLVTS